jgi:hypothetical protein
MPRTACFGQAIWTWLSASASNSRTGHGLNNPTVGTSPLARVAAGFLPVACSDVDYALKLRASGLKILWTPQITLYHHESKTRGLDHLDPEKRARSAAERAVLETRWGPALSMDPSLNPMWHKATLPFRLLAAPSQSQLWAHIEGCAAGNPWLPEPSTGPSPADAGARIGQ